MRSIGKLSIGDQFTFKYEPVSSSGRRYVVTGKSGNRVFYALLIKRFGGDFLRFARTYETRADNIVVELVPVAWRKN